MHTNRTTRLVIAVGLMLGSLLLAIMACGGGGGEEPTPQGGAGATSAAATIAAQSRQLTLAAQSAEMTQLAGGQQPGTSPQETEPPPQETQPLQTEPPTITAKVDTNCREGPLPDYEIVGALLKSQTSTVHGINQNRDWWYIENPQALGTYCWVWGETTQVTGDTTALELVQAPPPPEVVGGECKTPFDWQEGGFSNPVATWLGSGQYAQFDITAFAYVNRKCDGVELVVDLILLDAGDNQVFVASQIVQTDSNGKAGVHFTTAPVGSMPAPPVRYNLVWNFAPGFGSAGDYMGWRGDIQPPP